MATRIPLTMGAQGRPQQLQAADALYLPGRPQLDAHWGAVATDADGPTVTLDCLSADKHRVTLGGDRTLALSGDTFGQVILLMLTQDAGTPRTVTWWAGIRWPNGTVPTLTTGSGKTDVFSFIVLEGGVYLGFTVGLNL